MALTAAEVWRDYATDGIPSSGDHDPRKSDIRAWGGNIDILLNAGGLGGAVWKATRALLTADLAHEADTLAVVYEDDTSANNGLYVKVGASATGSWTQITTFLPGYQFVTATDDGSSTANAYAMDTNPRLPFGDGVALVEFVVPATNASETVTVSFDGDVPLTIKTASGNAPAIGGLIEGMPVSGVKIGADFFMRSDQASAALVAQVEGLVADAEAARDAAAGYADFARNNWAIAARFTGTGQEEDYHLAIDPASENNMFVSVGGVDQAPGGDEPPWLLVYDAGDAFIRINVPSGIKGVVRVSNSIPVGVIPTDGTVTEPKIASGAVTTGKLADESVTTSKHADNSVTFAKMQDIETLRLLGRVAAGSGDPGEITAAQLRDLFLPSGSLVDSKYFPTNGNTATTAVMPYDNTIPQNTEGTEFLSASITPKSATNKLRVRFRIGVTCSAVDNVVWGVFSSASTSALAAGYTALPSGGFGMNLVGEVEFTPGSTAPVTISVRVGSGAGSTVTLNGAVTLGGSNTSTLVVEEIKA